MQIEDYKEFIKTTAIYPKDCAFNYLLLGLIGEAGELCNSYKKVLRDKLEKDVWVPQLKKELGDFFWYLYQLENEGCVDVQVTLYGEDRNYRNLITNLFDLFSSVNDLLISTEYQHFPTYQGGLNTRTLNNLIYFHLDSSIEEILQINVDKLSSRKERGVLGGSGDDR